MKDQDIPLARRGFAETLKAVRLEAGFRTAYSFFHGNGGKEVFGFSYRMYLAMESGQKLPPFKAIPLIVHGLHLIALSEPAMRLVSAWLERKLGAGAFELLLKPLLKEPARPAPSPLHNVLKHSLLDKKIFLTQRQAEVIAGSRTSYLCWMVMSNDPGRWTPEALSKRIGTGPAAARAAMQALHRARLIKKAPGGAFRCPSAGFAFEYPRDNISAAARQIRKIQEELVRSGREIYMRRVFLRADLADLANYIPLLAMNTTSAQAYAAAGRSPSTAFFEVESKVVKILDI